MRILSVACSPRLGSLSDALAKIVADSARAHGAEIDRLNLAETPLPMMSLEGHGEAQPFVDDVVARMRAADAFIVASPEYHGSMSGHAKNFFDHGYHEFSGKLFGIVCATGGSQGTSCLTHMRATIQYCHGWCLPYQAAVQGVDFRDGEMQNASARRRMDIMGRDLVIYGRLLVRQFRDDLGNPERSAESFAGWHAKALAT